jgi:hypothetical protein
LGQQRHPTARVGRARLGRPARVCSTPLMVSGATAQPGPPGSPVGGVAGSESGEFVEHPEDAVTVVPGARVQAVRLRVASPDSASSACRAVCAARTLTALLGGRGLNVRV